MLAMLCLLAAVPPPGGNLLCAGLCGRRCGGYLLLAGHPGGEASGRMLTACTPCVLTCKTRADTMNTVLD